MDYRPSERYCKHVFLTPGESYNPEIYNNGQTIEDRCSEYYSPEEIAIMKGEIRVAECAICLNNLTDINNCIVCSDGHKFHNTCITDYWTRNPSKQNICPVTNTIPTHGWQTCSNINDINSGGRRRKTNKKRKSYKKSNKKRKSSKKSHKKRV